MDTSEKPKKLKRGLEKVNNNTGNRVAEKEMSRREKRDLFIKSYMDSYNPTLAALQSGKAINNAHSTLKKSEVQEKIKELREKYFLDTVDSKSYIQYNLVQIVERCMKLEPETDKDGLPTGYLKYDASNAIKALTLLGQEVGMFQKTIKIEMPTRDEAKKYVDNLKDVIDVTNERKP